MQIKIPSCIYLALTSQQCAVQASEEDARFLFQAKPRWIPFWLLKSVVEGVPCPGGTVLFVAHERATWHDCFSFPRRPGRVVVGAEQMFPGRGAPVAPCPLIGVTVAGDCAMMPEPDRARGL